MFINESSFSKSIKENITQPLSTLSILQKFEDNFLSFSVEKRECNPTIFIEDKDKKNIYNIILDNSLRIYFSEYIEKNIFEDSFFLYFFDDFFIFETKSSIATFQWSDIEYFDFKYNVDFIKFEIKTKINKDVITQKVIFNKDYKINNETFKLTYNYLKISEKLKLEFSKHLKKYLFNKNSFKHL